VKKNNLHPDCVIQKSLDAIDELFETISKEELDAIVSEVTAMNNPNGITADKYFDRFEYEHQSFFKC
jgi:AMMECR1 domain-containing protein